MGIRLCTIGSAKPWVRSLYYHPSVKTMLSMQKSADAACCRNLSFTVPMDCKQQSRSKNSTSSLVSFRRSGTLEFSARWAGVRTCLIQRVACSSGLTEDEATLKIAIIANVIHTNNNIRIFIILYGRMNWSAYTTTSELHCLSIV